MHLGSEEEITLLEFEEVEEGNQQEDPQAAAPEGMEQNPEELPVGVSYKHRQVNL